MAATKRHLFWEESVPRLVEALAGKRVAGAAAGQYHSMVWTEGGELHTFGDGYDGALGHGGLLSVFVPRVAYFLFYLFAGKRVVGAAAGDIHTVVWTEGGEVYTFGGGIFGSLDLGRLWM
jgi:alpha-tubulin suppressor-like RCC1 family protein